jgi:hypothetical protein
MMMTRKKKTISIQRVAFVPDLQVPYHSEAMVSSMGKFLAKWKPHRTIQVGDEIDLPQLRNGANTLEEAMGNIDDDRTWTKEILEFLGVTDVLGSNHGARVYKSLMNRLPAFTKLPEMAYHRFMGYDKMGIQYHPTGLSFAPGWVTIHGDTAPLSNKPGQSALNSALRAGKSVVQGHTHRLGLSAHSEAYKGNYGRILWGVEVGNLVDLSSSGMAYTRGYAQWQPGFCVGYLEKGRFSPVLVPMNPDGSFIFEGKKYK